MPQTIKLFLEEAAPAGAPGAINLALEQELERREWALDRHYHSRLHGRDRLLPFANAERILRLDTAPPADVALYCDVGLGIRPPRPGVAAKTVVLFHGLIGHPAVWIGNPLVDRYLALSAYVRDVVQSLLTMPDWGRRRCLDLRGFDAVDVIAAPLPCVERPEGDDEAGGEAIPAAVRRALASGDVIGHALQPRKADWNAVFAIVLELHRLERERGTGRRFRVIVFDEDYALLQRSLQHGYPLDVSGVREALAALDCSLEDVLLPSPLLSQTALFELFRAARFGLAYNTFPEYFGFYILESICHGCPVYTNGVGNNRHSLPPGHGVHVVDSADMAFGRRGAYAPVAQRIIEGLAAPDAIAAACRLGRDYAARAYSREAFAESLGLSLGRALEGPPPATPAFDTLTIALNPVVRSFDAASGRVVSDYSNLRLDAPSVDLIGDVIDRRAGDLHFAGERLDRLQSLFHQGVLALRAPTA